MKITIAGCFDLHDGYLGAANALRRKGVEVDFVPAHRYCHENPSGDTRVDLVVKDLQDQKPDVILWWRAEGFNGRQFQDIRRRVDGKFAMYSWDDPYQWEKHPEMPAKCKVLDVSFSCCMDSVKDYKKHGCESFYCPPGFDPSIHYPEKSEEHKSDVSLICTNLYSGNITKYPHVVRAGLLNALKNQGEGLDVRLYGTDNFKDIYPEFYKGWMPFAESRKVFHNSKISLCTHIRADGDMYINERVCQVLGSQGLLLVDGVKNMKDAIGDTFILMDLNTNNSFVDQIRDIVLNYDKYEEIKKSGYEFAIKNLTWDNWAETILGNIGE